MTTGKADACDGGLALHCTYTSDRRFIQPVPSLLLAIKHRGLCACIPLSMGMCIPTVYLSTPAQTQADRWA